MADEAPPIKRRRVRAEGKQPRAARRKTGKQKPALTSMESKKASQLLRLLERTERQFWKATIEEQLSQQATDRNNRRSEKRTLPKHEISTLALNEIAAKHGRGMFFYLPSREAWKTVAGETLAPACRDPVPPGSQYPSMVFANCVWNEVTTRDFYQNSHRARYLKANAIFSGLPKSTPLYAMQYVHHADFQLYATLNESIVVFATSDSFFLTTTRLIGPKRGRVRGGVEPQRRLEVPRLLWREGDTEGRLDQITSLEQLYERIVSDCALSARLQPTFSMEGLMSTVPRPVTPNGDPTAVPLGTPFAGETEVRTEPIRRPNAKKGRNGTDNPEEDPHQDSDEREGLET